MRGETEADFSTWVEARDFRRAAQWLVLRHGDEVIALCRAMVRDPSQAEDLAQDTFGRAFAGLAEFRGQASPRTWLLTIARNRCIDHLRARHRDPWGEGAGLSQEEPDEQPDQAPLPLDLLDRRQDVEAALAELPEGDRALIVLRFRNGLDYQELALAFGLREGTVRMRMSRALARMRRALEGREEMGRAAVARAMPAASVEQESAFAAAPRRRAAAEPPRSLAESVERTLKSAWPAPAAPSPAIEHPLTRYFAATWGGMSERLREGLLEAVRSIP